MAQRAGTSFMRSLCMGVVEDDMLFPYPTFAESEQETLHGVVDAIGQLLSGRDQEFAAWDVAGELPNAMLEQMKEFGLFGIVVPEEHGGMGFGSAAYSRVMQELARYDASIAITAGAHSSIGMRGLLLFGNDEQKARYMPRLATGELVAAFCLTEPGSGSDAASISTTATRDGDDWVLNGSKLWVTNGGIAQFFTVFAKTGAPGSRGQISAFIVTSDMEGVSHGPHEDKMGLRASSTTTVVLDNVRVPAKNLLGEEGKGFKVAVKILNAGRSGLGGGSVGAMKRVIRLASRQAQERKQFGKAIAEFGLIQQKIGQMQVDCYASESVVGMVSGWVDKGVEDYAVEAAISKVFTTECLWRTGDEALQVAGGNGYMREFPYERVLRDARINRIFEGTNDILRLFIGLSAMNDVGDQLKELASSLRGALHDPIKGFGVLSEYALKHAQLRGVLRSSDPLTRLETPLKATGEVLVGLTRELAFMADRLLRKHGKKIIDKQFATQRMADVMIDLFALSATLSRVDAAVKSRGFDATARERDVLAVMCHQSQRRAQANLAQIDHNVDEAIKDLARDAYSHDGYRWDTLE